MLCEQCKQQRCEKCGQLINPWVYPGQQPWYPGQPIIISSGTTDYKHLCGSGFISDLLNEKL